MRQWATLVRRLARALPVMIVRYPGRVSPTAKLGHTARGEPIVRVRRTLIEMLLLDKKLPELVQMSADHPPQYMHRRVYERMDDLELGRHRRELEQRRFVRALDRMMEEGQTRVTVQRIAELRGMPAVHIPSRIRRSNTPIDDADTVAITDVLQHWKDYWDTP